MQGQMHPVPRRALRGQVFILLFLGLGEGRCSAVFIQLTEGGLVFWPALLSHTWFVSPATKLLCLWQGRGGNRPRIKVLTSTCHQPREKTAPL